MAEYYVEPFLYTYAATPTWGTAQEGDGQNGTGFVAGTITLSGGSITAIAITNGGSGYSTNTKVYVSGTGTGAVVTVASVGASGNITGFTISNGGSGYTGTPTISLVPGAAIPAVGKIVFSAVPSSGTISVFGASVSTTNVIGAASADAAANALATNINATTATVSSSVSLSTHQLRNMVYARGPSTGAAAGTCEIMTRAGSQSLNYATNANAAITTTLNNSTVTQFGDSGLQKGRGGVWGWLVTDPTRDSSIWPSGIGHTSYGVFLAGTGAAPLMVVSSPGASDVVNIRCNNVEQHLGTNSSGGGGCTLTRATNYLWDDGSVWIGDTGTFTFTFHGQAGNFASSLNLGGVSGDISFICRTLGRFIAQSDARCNDIPIIGNPASGYRGLLSGIKFLDLGGSNTVGVMARVGTGNSCLTVDNCYFRCDRNSFARYVGSSGSGNGGNRIKVINCTFEWTVFTGNCSGVLQIDNSGGSYHIQNCRAIFSVEPSLRPQPYSFSSSYWARAAVALNMEGFYLPSTMAGILGSSNSNNEEDQFSVFQQGIGGKRAMRIETPNSILDWLPDGNFPVADSYLPDGTAWSYRLTYTNSSGNSGAVRPNMVYDVLALTKTNILSAGARTVAMELFVNDSYDHLLTDGCLRLTVGYIDNSDSKQKFVFSATPAAKLPSRGVALPASSKSWTGNGYSGTHVPRKIVCVTPTSVKPNTEIEAVLSIISPASNLQEIFINPELTIT